MTPTANQAFDAHPNMLRGQTVPNTLDGLGLPVAAARLRLRPPPGALIAAAGVILAGLALAFALGRVA